MEMVPRLLPDVGTRLRGNGRAVEKDKDKGARVCVFVPGGSTVYTLAKIQEPADVERSPRSAKSDFGKSPRKEEP